MTDCFQPCEREDRMTYQTITELNRCRIGYLIVTKSALVAAPEYLSILDHDLAHIQVTVTCMDDCKALQYEHASPPSQRINALLTLQAAGLDAAIRLSPIIEEFMDFDALNAVGARKCLIEFLRVNAWITKWLHGVDFGKYTVRHGGYRHLPLEEKQRILDMIHLPQKSVCEDVTEHYLYWRHHYNPKQNDCCNLRLPSPSDE